MNQPIFTSQKLLCKYTALPIDVGEELPDITINKHYLVRHLQNVGNFTHYKALFFSGSTSKIIIFQSLHDHGM